MFRMTPLGSCRIATPLRACRQDYGFAVNTDRVYGYCHSTAEAVQMMRFLHGALDFEPEIAPLVSRRGLAEMAPVHRPSDLYLVEISSAKMLSIGDVSIQLNYLGSEYPAFFSDPARALAFWKAVDAGAQDGIDDCLDRTWSASAAQRADGAVLRRIRRTTATEASLRRDIRSLREGLPATLFVTHVNAVTRAGVPIPSRARFIALVEDAVRAEGGTVYNPTVAMRRVGQALAIEDDSDSLAHFTAEFGSVVFRDWWDLAIEARVDATVLAGDDARREAILAAHLPARLAAGEGRALAARLERLAPACGGRALREARIAVHAALGQSEQCLRLLEEQALPGDGQAAADLLERRARLAAALGRHDDVEAACSGLLGLGRPLPEGELARFAEAMAEAGKAAGALRLLAMAVQQGGAGADQAAKRFVELAETLGAESFPAIPPGQVAARLGAADRLRLFRLTRDPALLAGLCSEGAGLDADTLAGLLPEVEAHQGQAAAARLLSGWRRAQGSERIVHARLRAVLDRWVSQVDPEASADAQVRGLQCVTEADPLHQEARIRLRALHRELLAQMRAAAEAGDLDALEALRPAVDLRPEARRDYLVLRMRLLAAQGYAGGAIGAARTLLAEVPDHLPAWVAMMRAAARINDLPLLDEASGWVIALSDTDSQRLAAEAADRRARLPAQAFAAARNEADALRSAALLQIARRNPALEPAAARRLRRIEARLSAELRNREAAGDAELEPFAGQVIAVLPDSRFARLSLGRFLLRKRDFAGALPHWEMLAGSAPGNAAYAQRRDQCLARLGRPSAGANRVEGHAHA